MAARIMWGSPGEDARVVDPDALDRADSAAGFTFLGRGEVGDAAAGPVTESEGGPVPAERLVYLVDEDAPARPIAVASERVAGNGDVLAAVEEEWRNRTGRTDVRPDAAPEPEEEQQSAKPDA